MKLRLLLAAVACGALFTTATMADVFNKSYNRKGRTKSSEYRFQHPDNFFEFTFLTSVFTHMLANDMEHYLSEIARTLKPGGRCMISFFLLTDESRRLMESGQSNPVFRHPLSNCTVSNPDSPEAAVAYDEHFVRQLLACPFDCAGFLVEGDHARLAVVVVVARATNHHLAIHQRRFRETPDLHALSA